MQSILSQKKSPRFSEAVEHAQYVEEANVVLRRRRVRSEIRQNGRLTVSRQFIPCLEVAASVGPDPAGLGSSLRLRCSQGLRSGVSTAIPRAVRLPTFCDLASACVWGSPPGEPRYAGRQSTAEHQAVNGSGEGDGKTSRTPAATIRTTAGDFRTFQTFPFARRDPRGSSLPALAWP